VVVSRQTKERKRTEVLIETFIRKQLGLKVHRVTKVESREDRLIIFIDRMGKQLLAANPSSNANRRPVTEIPNFPRCGLLDNFATTFRSQRVQPTDRCAPGQNYQQYLFLDGRASTRAKVLLTA